MQIVDKIVQNGIDFLFPPECCFCGRCLSTQTSSDFSLQAAHQPQLCNSCSDKLPETTENHCLTCGATQGPLIPARNQCVYCRGSHFIFSEAVSLHLYKNDFRKMCQFCKQDSGQNLVSYLTNRLWNLEANKICAWQCDAVVHVPMHWMNRLSRHVHPAESIANSLAKHLKIPHKNRALKQRRNVPQQALLAPSKRRKNVKKLFRTSRFCQFKDQTILLVDDILTTGTTANECAKVIKKAGAKKVYVAVLARGIGR